MEKYLAVDLGGTKLLIGESDRYGNITNLRRYPSGALDQRAAADLAARAIEEYLSVGDTGPRFEAIGIGLPGRVDPVSGVWLQIDPGRAEPTPLADELTRRFSIPAFIDNDVKSAALAVGMFELTDCRDYIYINVGTGLAAACVVDGRLIRGGRFNAGEVGHTRVGVNVGIRCGCGRDECVELIAAGVGFDRCARLLSGRLETEPGTRPVTRPLETGLNIGEERIDVREVFALARCGDPLCTRLTENAATALANLIMNLVRVTDPEAVVLGGGVVADGYLYDKVVERLNPTTVRFVTRGVRLTTLDPDLTGLKGAAAAAINRLKN